MNHLKNAIVKYINSYTKNISRVLNRYKKQIHSLFHFGEFARICRSFEKFEDGFASNSVGGRAVVKFCVGNKFKLVCSATAAR